MCGIAGVYCFSSQAYSDEHERALQKMKQFMHLRGPDASDYKHFDRVGLVHTRLSIIDVDARSTQPMESTQWLLSFNGEIINFLSIRNELQSKYTFKTHSDTEVLLLALEEWGIDGALNKCAGMYAFLAYNKTTQTLYAARDRLGIKPLYYFSDKDAIWLASTPATLVNGLSHLTWKENKLAVASFFALGAPFTTESTTAGIYQVPPANYLVVTPDGKQTLRRYWQPQYQEQFSMEDLIQVVQEYKTADVKSALFMSGGIDSTFLGSVLKDMDFFHLKSPELMYAEQVARTYKRPLIIVEPNPTAYLDGIKQVSATFGEPLMSCGIPYSVSYEASQRGYKMAISANGADELFFGYPRTPTLDAPLPKYEMQSHRWISEQLGHVFRDKRHFIISDYQSWIPSQLEIGQDMIKSINLQDFPACASFRWLEILAYVVNDLNPTLDAASMANSLEVRVPFLDHRIVQGVLSWPVDKICTMQYGRKSPLKEHLSKTFDQRFLSRPKLGFSIDDRALSDIKKLSDNAFDDALSKNFIQLRKENGSKFYERDAIYMKNIIQSFFVWRHEHASCFS